MDIRPPEFPTRLPSILDAIASAHFVTLDLELSGIPGQQPNRPKAVGEALTGKPHLQQRYEETKAAAEKYQVLQFGITCVDEDKDRGVYVTRPYNFFVNPVPDGRLDIERIFAFQSGAVEFLMSHKFRMEAPFLDGLSYLSREEEATARHIAVNRQNKARIAEIDLKEGDVEAMAFIQRVRSEITTWESLEAPKPSYLNIAPVGNWAPLSQDKGLNNYQKRLVHQLVQVDHPGLVTISRPGYIQIVAYNKEREVALHNSRMGAFEERLKKHIGLRWLVEAMTGGDLAAIESWNSRPAISESEKVKPRFPGLFTRLKKHRTVLVGHNLFTDLVYFYACFIGKLPDRVEDFEGIMHHLFPIIIDTKYIATHGNDNSPMSRSSLEELDEALAEYPEPLIEEHPEHVKYSTAKPAHEAGYDSYLTAKVLIRLTAKLDPAAPATPAGENSLPIKLNSDVGGDRATDDHANSDSSSEGVPLPTKAPNQPNGISNFPAPKSKRKSKGQPPPTPFSHATKFGILADESSSDENLIDLGFEGLGFQKSPKSKGAKRGTSKQPTRMMPPFQSDFWTVYANKLRVNGTVEGVCHLKAREEEEIGKAAAEEEG